MPGFLDSISNLGGNLFNGGSDFLSGLFNGSGNPSQTNQSNNQSIGGSDPFSSQFNQADNKFNPQQPQSFGTRLGQGVNNGFSNGLLFGQNGSQGLLNGAASIYNDYNKANLGRQQIDIAKGQLERNNALEDQNRASAVEQQNDRFRVSVQNSGFFNKLSAEDQAKFLEDNLVS
jgi:hypothetical protein